MAWVAGVDGCRAGWLAIVRDKDSRFACHKLLRRISEISALPEGPQIITIDIPIGLLDKAQQRGRDCDRMARSILGPKRASSVFSPPVRAALCLTEYKQALAENRRSSSANVGISRQCFALFKKIAEVDSWIDPQKQQLVREVHPELCFYAVNGGEPMPHGKKSEQGLRDRRKLMDQEGFGSAIDKAIAETHRSEASVDDVLDACVACWTAERILRKTEQVIPGNAPKDSKGLTMEMVY